MRFDRHAVLAAFTAALACALPAHAADTPADEAARMHYALGYQLGRDLAGVEARNDDLLRGMQDGRSGAPSQLSDEEMGAAMMALEQRVNEQRTAQQAAAAGKARSEGQAWLGENAKKKGVKTTASGLQYRVVTAGKGRTPTDDDNVTVHYKGTLIDGTEFDSSYRRGQPATFPVTGVIDGWTEALKLMKVGSKFELAIPPDLAYGGQGPLAHQVLLFEVELLEAAPALESAPQQPTEQ
jgi:FKBP-type peptidyl-prolyl cis-trans isomerase FklB